MRVLKFGGTSVSNAENLNKVVAIVKKSLASDKLIIVVSALGGTTDALIDTVKAASVRDESFRDSLKNIEKRHLQTVKELMPVDQQSATLSLVKKQFNEIENICDGIYLLQELSPRTLDNVVSYGELLSSLILSAKFNSLKMAHEWIDSRDVIRTNSNFGNANIDFDFTNKTIKKRINEGGKKLYLMPGFIASDTNKVTTTLGRGGSDYTAAVAAAAVSAKALEIWTDVSGMMTADPRLVNNARVIPNISYSEAMELSHFGAKVIYPPTIQPVMVKNIPVIIKNTFSPNDEGTLIQRKANENKNSIRGITSIGKITLLSLEGSGMVGVPGISKRFFGALSKDSINVILITQASSEYSICVAIDDVNSKKAKAAIDLEFENEINSKKIEPAIVENDLSIIAVVGENMKNHTGISGKMFSALGRNGINIRAIAQGSSEKNISTVIRTSDVKKAVNVLHEDFFETVQKQINLFIAGCGNVGSKLLEQLNKQLPGIEKKNNLQIRVVGIANSKKMLLNDDGINLSTWKDSIQKGLSMSIQKYADYIIEKNLRNSVFVDITANEDVSKIYGALLQKSISVVACNKIACSSSYKYYQQLKDYAHEFNAKFLFETNVGAALPIIGTLNDFIRSGDGVTKIEAVLSGTLNFVFNNYDGVTPFAEVVKKAQEEGYTEPDPRLDLSGKDVMRKILILAREAGFKMEMDDIKNNTFMPESCMKGSVADFYKELAKQENHFKELFNKAAKEGCKLKFVATLKNGKASVGLQHINKEHDLYHLYGKDNIVLFYTNRYVQQPLVIKGAGAGADVTASGIFADIMRAANI
jgi:bifunctional aspartokinase / homoserine dehydrogenase 1